MSGQLSRGRRRLEAGSLHGRDSASRDVSVHRAGLPAAPLGPARPADVAASPAALLLSRAAAARRAPVPLLPSPGHSPAVPSLLAGSRLRIRRWHPGELRGGGGLAQLQRPLGARVERRRGRHPAGLGVAGLAELPASATAPAPAPTPARCGPGLLRCPLPERRGLAFAAHPPRGAGPSALGGAGPSASQGAPAWNCKRGREGTRA